MSVRIGGVEFDNNLYDRDADVLYLHVGSPAEALDWDDSVEGDGVRYAADGSLVGITILNARRRLERDGKITITLPQRRLEVTDLNEVLTPA